MVLKIQQFMQQNKDLGYKKMNDDLETKKSLDKTNRLLEQDINELINEIKTIIHNLKVWQNLIDAFDYWVQVRGVNNVNKELKKVLNKFKKIPLGDNEFEYKYTNGYGLSIHYLDNFELFYWKIVFL